LFPNKPGERSLLITDDESLLETEEEVALYRTFRETLWARRGDRFATAKSVVNRVVDHEYALKNARIAVHKFGPVPVFALDRVVKLPVHGHHVEARVALYPKKESKQPHLRARYRPECIRGKHEFRESMTVAPRIVFRRYFEDIAEDFHDLRRTLRLENVYHRAKRIESTLGASVKSKLDAFVPKVRLDKAHDQEGQEAWKYFQDNAGVLYESALCHDYALFLLNEMYRLTGIYPMADKYTNSLAARHVHFALLLGETKANEIRNSSPVIKFVEQCLVRHDSQDLFHYNQCIAARDLLTDSSDASPYPWCGEIAKFAAFVILLQRFADKNRHVRVFVSFHHEVPSSKLLREQIVDFVRSLPRVHSLPIFVSDLPAGTPFAHVIRAAIWCSHGAIAICPANTSTISSPHEKNYKWIARESEHAVLLKKRLIFGVQNGADADAILADLSDPGLKYLVTGSKLIDNRTRAERLVNAYRQNVISPFKAIVDSPSGARLDPQLAENLSSFAHATSVSALNQLLDGYLRQFERNVQKALIYTLHELDYLGKHPRIWITRKLAQYYGADTQKAARAFDNMKGQVKNRRISVRGKPASLISQLPGDERYFEHLSRVIRVLHPSVGRKELRDWRKSWLNKWIRQFPT
jgi:hypothetical protein